MSRPSLPTDDQPLLLRLAERVGLTRTGVVVLATAVLAWIVARVLGGRMVFLLAYGAVLVLVLARTLGRAKPALTATRSELPPRLRQGQSVQVRVDLEVPRRTGLFVLEERLHPALGRNRTVPVGGAGEAQRIDYTVTPRLRGVYEVGPLVAVWSDPFGLTRRVTEVLPATEVVVHPSTEGVTDRPLTRQWEDPPIRPPQSKPWPSGFEFYGMRDYVLGDDLRRVVWKAVARTGRMLTRESEQGITDQVTIVLDTDITHHSPGVPSDTFEAGVRAAASLAVRHLRDGFTVTLLGPDGPIGQPTRGERGRIPTLDAFARVVPSRTPLSKALDGLVMSGRRDAHTLVVTPWVDAAVGARCRVLVDRGTRVTLAVLTWEDSDPSVLHLAGSTGCQVVVLRPLTPLDAAFRAASESVLPTSDVHA
ncbi:MAG: hypothetical protein QOE64_1712 [Frankiales bacterium]|nr:hypothetical protein [Frankiales bacterium]